MIQNLSKWAIAGAGASATYLGLTRYDEIMKRKSIDQENAIRQTVVDPDKFHLNSYNHLNDIKKWDWNWDHREPTKVTDEKTDDAEFVAIKRPGKRAYRNLFLIRHGQYDTSAEGDENRKLTVLGHEQGRQTGVRLAHWFNLDKERALKKFTDENPDASPDDFNYPKVQVIQSSMTRAKETSSEIQEIFKSAKVDFEFAGQSDLLREGPPYPTEPKLTQWAQKHTYWEESARIESGFRTFIHRADEKQEHESNELVVCHANVIRYFLCRVLQIPPEAWLRFSLRHGSITWVRISPSGSVSIRSVGEAGYMPVDKCSRR